MSAKTNSLVSVLSSCDFISTTHHFHFLPRYSATHVCAAGGREQRRIAEIVDPLLPRFGCLFGRVDILQTLTVDEVDRIFDPAALDLDG